MQAAGKRQDWNGTGIGVMEMGQRGRESSSIYAWAIGKAKLVFGYSDALQFYVNKVGEACRSRMNVPFFLRDNRLDDEFLAGAKARGLAQLKGHRAVGGMRASIYNAMPIEGVSALCDYLREFAHRRA